MSCVLASAGGIFFNGVTRSASRLSLRLIQSRALAPPISTSTQLSNTSPGGVSPAVTVPGGASCFAGGAARNTPDRRRAFVSLAQNVHTTNVTMRPVHRHIAQQNDVAAAPTLPRSREAQQCRHPVDSL